MLSFGCNISWAPFITFDSVGCYFFFSALSFSGNVNDPTRRSANENDRRQMPEKKRFRSYAKLGGEDRPENYVDQL